MLELLVITHSNILLETLCKIPENVGWALVGALGACCGWILADLIKIGIQMRKDRQEEEEE